MAPEEPLFPEDSEDALAHFFVLDQRRQSSMGDYQPLQCTEIEAYFRITGHDCDPVMADMILNIDGAYLPALRELLGEAQDVRSSIEAAKRGS